MTARNGLRWLLALVYVVAGLLHLLRPQIFLPIMPDWVPAPREVVLLTGLWELMGATALLWPSARANWWGGVGMAVYAVVVYPANIRHALDGVVLGSTALGWGYHVPRLAAQPLIVWWALWAGRVIDWPFSRPPFSRRPFSRRP